jgi:Coenzyme PQQ synthesis protein D (PqqD)
VNMNSAFVVAPEVRARVVGDETVMIDLVSGTYFGLDSIGARIWQLIEQGKSLSQVCDALVEEYNVSRDVMEQDILALARDLVDKKLITIA